MQDGVYAAFTKRLAETAGAVKVADRFEPRAVIGPLIDMKAVERPRRTSPTRSRRGPRWSAAARAVQGGSFFEPTVLTDMVITNEETFGPVAPRSTASRAKTKRSRWPTTPPP